MEIPKKFYFKIRPLILPINKILNFIPKRSNILDLGCGKGLLINHIKDFIHYTGVDLIADPDNSNGNIKFFKDNCLSYIKNDLSEHNTFLIIDLIHHIPVESQSNFLNLLISSLKSGDVLIIKDINPRNFIYKFWNSFHDFIISKQIINYLDFEKLKENLPSDIQILANFHSRIFLYDHYFLVLKKS